ncbi:hypothetical protein EJ08DRAFT_733129 [Tothia fuscella]|uniref:5'-3' DNA helicase ZGRF1-like N-terminal domain-containing protein n=1 Tax=Tothia fuscella TaxID=1048955 RepID=A0A9P4NUQ0_9PEZI|nr:hypothetical protein EJ08DRAFT_733129 [Tothia fuscella]
MTAATARGTSTSTFSVPQTQNSAPVHSFRCLFTHDVRRKQKRWHDGLLKFHTFNKRVMVYDETRNFIGDTHFKERGGLHTGDEVFLEEGIVVEIGEGVGTSQTDLTPLFERERGKKMMGEEGSSGGMSNVERQRQSGGTPVLVVQKKHRSLNALLGGQRGSIGRAAVGLSPYEARHGGIENEIPERASAKRRKAGETEPQLPRQWNLAGVTKSTKSTPLKQTPLWARTADAQSAKSRTAPTNSGVNEVVDISSDNDDFADIENMSINGMSDVTIPGTSPPKARNLKKVAVLPAARPAIVLARKSKRPPALPPAPSSPPVSVKNSMKNVQSNYEAEEVQREHSSPVRPQKIVYQALKLGKSQPRPMLLCQPLQKPKPAHTTSRGSRYDPFEFSDSEAVTMPKNHAKAKKKDIPPPAPVEPHSKEPRTGTGLFPRRAELVSEDTREGRTSSPAFDTIVPPPERFEAPARPATVGNNAATNIAEPSKQKPLQGHGPHGMAIAHGLMDQRLMSASAAIPKPKTLSVMMKSTKTNISEPTPDRPFRRVQSENDILPKFADSDFDTTLSPIQQEDHLTPATTTKAKSKSKSKSKPTSTSKKKEKATKQPFQRSTSLTDTMQRANPKAKVKSPPKAPATPKGEEGAWTVEATDLFDWRPPNWDAREKRKKAAARAEAKESAGKK